jgi:hypothetical protein
MGLSVEFETHIGTRMVSLDLGGRTVMMGTKARRCAPLPKDISLEDLAPKTTSAAAWRLGSTSRS